MYRVTLSIISVKLTNHMITLFLHLRESELLDRTNVIRHRSFDAFLQSHIEESTKLSRSHLACVGVPSYAEVAHGRTSMSEITQFLFQDLESSILRFSSQALSLA